MKMVKINGVWNVRFKTESGFTKTVSTKCTDREEADKVVREAGIEKMELAAKAGRLTQQVIGHIVSGKKMTMEKAVAEYEAWMDSIGRSPKTVFNNASTLRSWIHDAKLGSKPPSGVTEKDIDKWINDAESGSKAGTRAVNLAAIRSFYSFACAKGWSPTDPSALTRVRMNILSHEQKEKGERIPFSELEVKHMLAMLEKEEKDPFWMFAIAASFYLGLRLGDICQLEWSCFKKPGHIIVWTDKRDRRVSLKLPKPVADIVSTLNVGSKTHLFPSQMRMVLDPTRRAALSVQFKRLCERYGVRGKSFHCLRHSCLTNWHRAGLSLEQIAEDAGHSDTKTTEGYIH